jgi:hypothetical protein
MHAIPKYVLNGLVKHYPMLSKVRLRRAWWKHKCCTSCTQDKEDGYGNDIEEICCCELLRFLDEELKEKGIKV